MDSDLERPEKVKKSEDISPCNFNIEPVWADWKKYSGSAGKDIIELYKLTGNQNSTLSKIVQNKKNRPRGSVSAERLPLKSEQQSIRKLKPASRIPKPCTPLTGESRSFLPVLTPKSTPARMSGHERGYRLLPSRVSIQKLPMLVQPEHKPSPGQGQLEIKTPSLREKFMSAKKAMDTDHFRSPSIDGIQFVTPTRVNDAKKTFSGLSINVMNAAPRMHIDHSLFMNGTGNYGGNGDRLNPRRLAYGSPCINGSTPKAVSSARSDSTRKPSGGDSGRWTSDGRVSRSRQRSASTARDSAPKCLELSAISPPPPTELSFQDRTVDLANAFQRNCQVTDTPIPTGNRAHKLLRRSSSTLHLINRKGSFTSPRKSTSEIYLAKDNSSISLEQPIAKILSDDWEENLEGFRVLVNVLHENPERIRHNLAKINNAGIKQMANLRSQVCRAALNFIKELFETLGRAMEHDLEKLTEKLLDKSADTNKFIREDACTALEAMVENLSPNRIVHTMEKTGAKHRNNLVRTTAARIMELLVRRLGPDRVLAEMAEEILPMIASFLQEGSLDTRMYAKDALAPLVCHPRFESLFRRYVCAELIRQVNKTVVSVKQDMIDRKSSTMLTY